MNALLQNNAKRTIIPRNASSFSKPARATTVDIDDDNDTKEDDDDDDEADQKDSITG